MKAWKESACLILAAQKGLNVKSSFNYSLLLLKRHPNTKFPGSYVYPGGLIEPADGHLKWQKLFENQGCNKSSFDSLFTNSTKKLEIFREVKHELPRQISLRISAIRETFEECGVLICKKPSDHCELPIQPCDLQIPKEELNFWQKKVHNDANEFFNMCENFKCHPNLWALQEWSNWLTPTFFQARFDAVFFFTMLSKIPDSNLDYVEMQELLWIEPKEMMENPLIWSALPPPQQYTAIEMSKYKNSNELLNAMELKSKREIKRNLPMSVILKNGSVHLLPGDSMYPDNIDPCKKEVIDKTNLTIEQFRNEAQKIHRLEIFDSPDIKNNLLSKF
ncbi:nucleoside diphosphate-linked moiety X motif 19-like [Trichogramma pretiosum]|uniref:nucleoside diphosphate-linked moiety X motif 19-like n=1 Tax=Trichogramma pretiosum TaxID=7493 RepID=UPI0006C96A1A|nr:nucleoside diphosphate-linked moiety X motif 19-like [Trichogramma pretiosum]